ncbi:MAG: hypothetical protein LBT30_08225 [Clostridiales bacterium]|jgi:hypothetical protein|nr:hypothetical protein [Clostridiales bacterium]
MNNGTKNFFDRTKTDFTDYFTCFYAKNKNRLGRLWIAVGAFFLIGIISGLTHSERFFVDNFFLIKNLGAYGGGMKFASFFFLHTAYFAIAYITVCNLYCSLAGFAAIFAVAFKLGSSIAALIALYGIGGLVNAVLVYIPVNAVLLAALSSYLLVCTEHSGGFKNRGLNRFKPSYKAALRESLYFLPVVLAADILAFVIVF